MICERQGASRRLSRGNAHPTAPVASAIPLTVLDNSCSFTRLHSILCFRYVQNHLFQRVFAINNIHISTPRPNPFIDDWMRVLSQDACGVGFELIANFLRPRVCGYREMNMVRSGTHRVQFPTANLRVATADCVDFVSLAFI